jgi:hypothetical protein
MYCKDKRRDEFDFRHSDNKVAPLAPMLLPVTIRTYSFHKMIQLTH